MAHYVWNESVPLGRELRELLDAVYLTLHRSQKFNGALNQMSNAQISAALSFSDGVAAPDATTAGAAKSELLSDLGKLLTDASQTGVNVALRQLLDQFA